MSQSIYRSGVEFFPSVPRLTRTPNYALRRAIAATLAAAVILFVVIVIGLLAGLGGRPASAFQAAPAISSASPTVVVAEAGDSLWSIAQAHHGQVGLDRYVDALISINGGTAIQAGQAVRLP